MNIFATIMIGESQSSGSNSLAMTDRTVRLVILGKPSQWIDTLTSNWNPSEAGFQAIPSILLLSGWKSLPVHVSVDIDELWWIAGPLPQLEAAKSEEND